MPWKLSKPRSNIIHVEAHKDTDKKPQNPPPPNLSIAGADYTVFRVGKTIILQCVNPAARRQGLFRRFHGWLAHKPQSDECQITLGYNDQAYRAIVDPFFFQKRSEQRQKAARSSGDLPVKILLAKILSVLRLPALTGNKLWLRGGLRDRLPRRQIDRNAV